LNSIIRKILPITVIIIIWLSLTLTETIRPIFVPGPQHLWKALVGLKGILPRATFISLSMTLAGFGIGISAGVGLAFIMAYSKVFLDLLGPAFEFSRPIPIFALIPLFILWFGIGRLPQVLFIGLGVAGIMGVNTQEAIKNMPSIYLKASYNLGANKKRVYRTIILPYIFPHLIGTIRFAAAASWGLEVAAEFMGSQAGLGFNMIVQQVYLNTSGIIILVIIYCAMAIIFDMIIGKIEVRLTRWTERHISESI